MTEPKTLTGAQVVYQSLEVRSDAHVPTGPDDVRVMVMSEWKEAPEMSEEGEVVRTLVRPGYAEYRVVYDGPPRSSRRRFLVWRNATGGIVCAPCMLSHRLSLFFGMGKQWYFGAMAAGGFADA